MEGKSLARFITETMPRLRNEARKGVRLNVPAAKDMNEVLDALELCLELMRKAEKMLTGPFD